MCARISQYQKKLPEKIDIQNLQVFDDLLTAQAQKLYQQHIAQSSRKFYAADVKIFTYWCLQRNIKPLSATPQIIALFLTHQFHEGLKPPTLTRRLSALKFYFAQHNLISPTEERLPKTVLKGIRRDETVSPTKKKNALSITALKKMVDLCETSTLRGIRDKAILLLLFMGAYRRSELTAITFEDIVLQEKGLEITLKKIQNRSGRQRQYQTHFTRKRSILLSCTCRSILDLRG